MTYQAAVTAELNRWPGREFRPGEPAMCMNFVRHVLNTIGAPLGKAETARPFDGHWTGPELASSLAGKDLGQPIFAISDLQPGDVLFWDDTYHTGFPPGTITHVGLSVGGRDFVHRPTSARPVERASLSGYWYDKFRCGLRPSSNLVKLPGALPATDPEPARTQDWKVYVGPQQGSALVDTVMIDANGRATMTAQVLAALTGHKLVVNNKARAIRFEPQ